MHRKIIPALCFVLAGCDASSIPVDNGGPASQSTATCQIARVVDGDTVDMQCAGGVSGNMRLVGFDAPESYEPRCRAEAAAGLRAKNALRSFTSQAKVLTPEFQGVDRYGRPLVRLYLDGRDTAQLMVNSGNAVYYSGGRRIDWCRRLA